jgi:D-alanyl-D-alanine dipeptidase
LGRNCHFVVQLHSVFLRSHLLRHFISCFSLVAAGSTVLAQEQPAPALVNVKSLDPTIVVELRYATHNNVSGTPIYPKDMPALLRPEVAQRVVKANAELRARGFGLKIWDAYRPKAAHEQLWEYWPDNDYVASPAEGGSLHTRGVAVDATLVNAKGREVKMPTDFDDFTPAAMLHYTGPDPMIRRHLRILQGAMARAGFYGLRTEWWHFVAKDWQNYPVADAGAPPPPLLFQRPTGGPQGSSRARTR